MRSLFVWVFGLGLLIAGCGPSGNRPMTKEEESTVALDDVGELYRVFTAQKKKAPTKLADFVPFEPMSPMGLQALQRGDVVVRFGATLPDTKEEPGVGPDDEVLAYEKDVPVSGGRALMLNRTIKTMTADEFKAVKLAGTSSSEPVKGRAK